LITDNFELRSLGVTTVDDSHQSCEIFTVESPTGADGTKEQTRNQSWHAGAWPVPKDFSPTPPVRETADVLPAHLREE
jgi:hypothetical protein